MINDFSVDMNEYLPLRDVVFNTLRKAILKGELKPGERLMEIALAERLGVSRTPVREAMRKLELEGLVVMIPRRGAQVANITEKDLHDVLEVRIALENLSIENSCARMTEEQLAELWKAALIKYMQLHKPSQVKLVLPASGSSARMSQIPYASGKQLAKLAQNVMAESSGESVSDYAVIQSDKKQGISLCCGSADTDTLLKMIGICMEAGLPLREITVPMEGYLKILAQLKEYRKKTAIYLFFEENSVTSLLYREGIYLYSTRSRLFSDRGTVDF